MGWSLSKDLVQFGLTIGAGVGVASVLTVGAVLLVLRGIVGLMDRIEAARANGKQGS